VPHVRDDERRVAGAREPDGLLDRELRVLGTVRGDKDLVHRNLLGGEHRRRPRAPHPGTGGSRCGKAERRFRAAADAALHGDGESEPERKEEL
jgi:hypothetical protein